MSELNFKNLDELTFNAHPELRCRCAQMFSDAYLERVRTTNWWQSLPREWKEVLEQTIDGAIKTGWIAKAAHDHDGEPEELVAETRDDGKWVISFESTLTPDQVAWTLDALADYVRRVTANGADYREEIRKIGGLPS